MANKVKIEQQWKDMAHEHGISESLLYTRVRAKWKPELAATTPKGEIPPDRFLPKPEPPPSKFPVSVTYWTPEQINSHLAKIGPDPSFPRKEKESELAITAPRQKLNGTYYKPGEAW